MADPRVGIAPPDRGLLTTELRSPRLVRFLEGLYDELVNLRALVAAGGGGGGAVQDALSPPSSVFAPSVNAVNAGLASHTHTHTHTPAAIGAAPAVHSHAGLLPQGGATGATLKKTGPADYQAAWGVDETGGGVGTPFDLGGAAGPSLLATFDFGGAA